MKSMITGEMVASRETVPSSFNMGDDDQRAHRGLQRIMLVYTFTLIFDKVFGFEHFPNVVKAPTLPINHSLQWHPQQLRLSMRR